MNIQTVLSVIAEAFGFNLVRNSRQLVSYAGLDVVQKQSGTSVRAERISPSGAMLTCNTVVYFPAFSAVRHNKTIQLLYEHIVKKENIKMKGYVAAQRKLLY